MEIIAKHLENEILKKKKLEQYNQFKKYKKSK